MRLQRVVGGCETMALADFIPPEPCPEPHGEVWVRRYAPLSARVLLETFELACYVRQTGWYRGVVTSLQNMVLQVFLLMRRRLNKRSVSACMTKCLPT